MKFSYKARTKEGRMEKGKIEASSRKAALDILEKYGLYITSLNEDKSTIFNKNLVFGKEVSSKDLVMFTRQLGTMLKSAIPPLEAFRSQVAQTKNQRFRQIILRMTEAIETGSALSQAFAMYPKVFDTFYVSIIKSGEATGKVADALNYLAEHLEREYNFNQKIKSAMLYPAFVVAVFFAAGGVVIFFIVPKLSEILKNFSTKLPWMTRALIWLADFISKGGWVVAPIILIPLFIAPIYFKKSVGARKFYHRNSLKVPLLGEYFKKIYIVRFAENLSVLMAAGLPIVQALKITKGILTNSLYKKALGEAEELVARGEKISMVLGRHPKLFSGFVLQMVATGEETGQLDKTLMDLVVFYRGEIERTTEQLVTLLEPIMILVLGIAIAILAFAVFIPLFNMGLNGGF